MPIGIRPTNDFAFKKTFGTPENKICLISLLNAILNPQIPIEDVTIGNPYNLQDFEDDKLSILDLKAIDKNGAVYNIEMQMIPSPGMVKRLVYYGCRLFTNDFGEGDDYQTLCPVFSICIMHGVLWKDSQQVLHRFRLMDELSKRTLDQTLEIHTV